MDEDTWTLPPLPPGCFAANETRAWATKDTCDGFTCDGLALTCTAWWCCCCHSVALFVAVTIRMSLVLATAAARSSGRGSGEEWEVWGTTGCSGGDGAGCNSGGDGAGCNGSGGRTGCSLISRLHCRSFSCISCCMWCWCGGGSANAISFVFFVSFASFLCLCLEWRKTKKKKEKKEEMKRNEKKKKKKKNLSFPMNLKESNQCWIGGIIGRHDLQFWRRKPLTLLMYEFYLWWVLRRLP